MRITTAILATAALTSLSACVVFDAIDTAGAGTGGTAVYPNTAAAPAAAVAPAAAPSLRDQLAGRTMGSGDGSGYVLQPNGNFIATTASGRSFEGNWSAVGNTFCLYHFDPGLQPLDGCHQARVEGNQLVVTRDDGSIRRSTLQ